MDRTKIALGIVHPGSVTHGWHVSVLKLTHDPRFEVVPISVESGPLISRARNKVLDLFLTETDADYLLWTDSDIEFEADTLQRLLDDDKDVVSGLYFGKDTGGEVFPVFTNRDKGSGTLHRPSDPPAELEEVFGVGMGFCLIKRGVIERLSPVSALYPFAEKAWHGRPVGEDVMFCILARGRGFKVWLQPQARVGHRKAVTL